MALLEAVRAFFRRLNMSIHHGLDLAKGRGLEDKLVAQALVWVRVAAQKFEEDEKRREWVVHVLEARGVSESIARLAVELAFQILKAELKGK